jgi:hypothetical protein
VNSAPPPRRLVAWFVDRPPTNTFWSVTVYDKDGYPVANALNRFALGDRDPIKFAADGSLELYLAAQSPGGVGEANLLPTPRAASNLTMRLYAPRRSALEGSWSPRRCCARPDVRRRGHMALSRLRRAHAAP